MSNICKKIDDDDNACNSIGSGAQITFFSAYASGGRMLVIVRYITYLTSCANLTTYTMDDVPLALRSRGTLRHVAA